MIVLSGALLGAITFFQELRDSNRKSEQSAAIYLKASVSQAARMIDHLFRNDEDGNQVVTLVSQLGASQDDLSVLLFNDKNVVIRASDYSRVGSSVAATVAAPLVPIFSRTRQTLQGTVQLSPDRSQLIAVYPILLKPLPNELRASRVGVLFVDYSLAKGRGLAFQQALRRALLFNVLLVILGLCIWIFFQSAVTTRIRKLIEASQALGGGDRKARSALAGSDELAEISVAFDQMAEKIEQNSVEVDRQVKRELILRGITERIATFGEIKRIFQVAVNEMLPYLEADRVAVYQFDQESQCSQGTFVAEAFHPDTASLLSVSIEDTCFSDAQVARYLNGRNHIIDNVPIALLDPCYRDLLNRLGIQSNLVVPLICGTRLWGLFCVHQCKAPRRWIEADVAVVNHVVRTLGIAIQQADLFAKLEAELQEKKLAEANLLRTNEELARSTRLKDQFLANMSHELRTPLNGILGMAESMQENIYGEISPMQRQALGEIESSGAHLLDLINDVLDITKIEAGKLEVELKPVAISALCRSCIKTIQPMAQAKSITLSADIQPGLSVCLLDQRLIRQVLINLLSNAVKFTPEAGTVRLQARMVPTKQADPLQGTLYISVLDSGIGIDAKDHHQIFKPFVQVQSGLNRQFAGTGLGLSIVKRILQAHGGDIALESAVGKGSCFSIQLPVQLHAESVPKHSLPETREAEASVQDSNAGTDKPQILLAEDSRVNRQIYTRYLIAKGYQVNHASNGQEAIDFLRHQVPSLLILDMSMPVVDGFEVLRVIRSSDKPELAALPIIVLTALAMKGDREKCMEAGATEYLAKPVKLHQLDLSIKAILESVLKS
ncbi:ATP-binding protein [Synechococcus sp. CS-1332]|uniref:ATP-binding protein n=1 Tax=Synechococcus sp. CS-1332 TaxID=2847972 RepID=UPI00223BCDFD|nr:ATP-binding protein [Synechococcus sp. CS-1332]MCT0206895.1 response regulator [Synechococcus sp. CS-1332]